MKACLLLLGLMVFSANSYAEKCEGMNACVSLYEKLTGDKLKVDEAINDDMTLASNDTDLTAADTKSQFEMYLNKNGVRLHKNSLWAVRAGEFLTAPIYVVSQGNMPQMINKDGLVTLVYHAKKKSSKLVPGLARFLSKKKIKDVPKIVEYLNTNTISVSDTFEHAEKIMTKILKADK